MASNGRTNGITTALIYTRVSSDEQAREGLSLPTQLADTRRYAAQMGCAIGSEYQDVLSGKRDDRPQYQQLLSEVRQLRAEGQQVVVVVAALDRLGRRLLERVRAREELKALGVPTYSVREGGEVSDLVANILASVAQEEVRRLGERVSIVREHIVATGWYYPGASPPWGYRFREATPEERAAGSPKTVLDLDEAMAPYVRETFHRVAAGETINSVARWVRTLPSGALGGRQMAYPPVRRMLHSPIYVSRPKSGVEDVLRRPPCRWPALTDDATWTLVQERIASHAHMPRQASGNYLLSGLIRCPSCGSRMSGCAMRKQHALYRCERRRFGAGIITMAECNRTVLGPAIDAAVLDEAAALLDTVMTTDRGLQMAIRQAWRRLQEPPESDEGRRVRDLEREAERARQRLKNAARLLVDGTLDKTGYELVRDEARRDLEAIEVALERIGSRKPDPALPDLDVVLGELGGWVKALQEADIPAKRDVLAVLVQQVVPVRQRIGVYSADITWTPLGQKLYEMAATLRGTNDAQPKGELACS